MPGFFGGRFLRGKALLLPHLFLHTVLHFAKSFFDFPGGGINRDHQFEDKLVKEVQTNRQ